jgi:SagB-type dehydrogenase family enzyme
VTGVARGSGSWRLAPGIRGAGGLLLLVLLQMGPAAAGDGEREMTGFIQLPAPARSGGPPLEELLERRRSVRDFAARPLTLAAAAQLAWAAQGVTHRDGLRTAPSAGALYPLELYIVAGAVEGLEPGIYRYLPAGHRLARVAAGDRRQPLSAAALGQAWVADAPAIFVLAAVYERTTGKYAGRGRRYVHMEAGHAAQNLFLQAGALGLSTVVVGAFDDPAVASVLHLPHGVTPLGILPVGTQREAGR